MTPIERFTKTARDHGRGTPAERIASGFAVAREGIATARIEHEQGAREQAQRLADLVGAQYTFKAAAIEAMRAQRERCLQPGEVRQPRPVRDGPADAVLDPRGERRAVLQRVVTADSLRTMGLVQIGLSPEEREARELERFAALPGFVRAAETPGRRWW